MSGTMSHMDVTHADLLGSIAPAVLGARIRATRISRQLTQTDLAGDDVSVGYISRIESGSRKPTAVVLTKLAGRLEVTVDELLLGVSPRRYDEVRLGLDYAELALETGEALEAERQARLQLDAATELNLDELAERGRFLLARALEALGDLDNAVIELEQLLPTSRGLTAIRAGIALSRCYRESGDLALAIEVGERLAPTIDEAGLGQTDEAVQLAVTVAAAYIDRGDLAMASRVCATAVRRAETITTPGARAGAYWEASIVHAQRGEIRAALPLASRALAILSEGRDTRNLARLRMQLGGLQLQLDDPPLAEVFEQIDRADQELSGTSASEVDLAHGGVIRAQAHLMAGEPELAMATAEAAQERAGERALQVQAEALVVRGQALAAMDQPEAARACYQAAVLTLTGAGADRAAAQLWFELADLLEELGDHDGAREAYRSAAATSGLVSRRTRLRQEAVKQDTLLQQQ